MTGKRWAVLGLCVALLGSVGCACCSPGVCRRSVEAGPDCPVPLDARRHVYVFMVDSLVPGGSSGVDGLRDGLAAQGFMKVATGQVPHALWMRGEIRRIHADDPAARFVLVGFDVGGPVAERLAADAIAAGVPVDGVVLLDPRGSGDRTGGTLPRLAIFSGAMIEPGSTPNGAVIPEARHAALPSHPEAVASVGRFLTDVAARVEPGAVLPTTEPAFEHAPPPRAVSAPGPDAPAEWNFLLDVPGTHAEPLAPVSAPPAVRGSEPGLAPGLQGNHSARPRP